MLIPSTDATQPAAIAGYPIVTGLSASLFWPLLLLMAILRAVPLGFFPSDTPLGPAEPTRDMGPHMPFGISFLGTAYTEFSLISYAYAYEQATHTRLKQLAYPEAIPKTQLKDVVKK